MPARRKNEDPLEALRRPPGTTPDARERQLIALAYDEAERQIREKTASSQLLTHFIKAGSSREMIEKERLAREVELMEAKKEAMAAAGRMEEMMGAALDAFKSYSGQDTGSFDD